LTTAGGQKLEVPPGAVPLNTSGQATSLTFTAEAVSTPPKPLPVGVSALGPVAKFGPEGVNFAWPVVTTLPIPSSATSLTGLQYKRYVPAIAQWVSYPGFAFATDSSDRVIGASVASYDLGYDSLAMLNTPPTADVSVAAEQPAPRAAQQPRRRSANELKRAAIPSADLPENRLEYDGAGYNGRMKWVGEKCPENVEGYNASHLYECHYYLVAKSYKPKNESDKADFEFFLNFWYNKDLGCAWNSSNQRFEAIGDGICYDFRTGSESTGDPAPSTLFDIRQGEWEFCVTGSQWITPGGFLTYPGKWSYSKLVPVSITEASHNTCQNLYCWSKVVDIKLPGGGEWLTPAQMTPCPTSSTGTPTAATVIISPATASISIGATQVFTATVSGASNKGVTWSATGGTVSSAGLYKAPAVAGTYYVTATSQADSTKKAVATIIVNAPATVALTISPTTVSIDAGATQAFTAMVSGSTNRGVAWSVQEGTTGGTISTSGVYTAPTVAGTYHVVATSQADSTKKAVATIIVNAPATVAVTVSPTTASISTSATQAFVATVSGSTNQGVTWTATGGIVSSAGLYTAPAVAGTYYVTATSQADTSKKAVVTITVSSSSSPYTKIANNGASLPNGTVLGFAPTDWACTKDNSTNLIWEVKTGDDGLRDKKKTYTNYDDMTKPQKPLSGTINFVNPTLADIDAAGNSMGFVKAVNAIPLCGFRDWRMPTKEELSYLKDKVLTYPRIDPTYFPNTPNGLDSYYWSKSTVEGNPGSAWYVDFMMTGTSAGSRSTPEHVRLVRP
jgi:hypothetical protein